MMFIISKSSLENIPRRRNSELQTVKKYVGNLRRFSIDHQTSTSNLLVLVLWHAGNPHFRLCHVDVGVNARIVFVHELHCLFFKRCDVCSESHMPSRAILRFFGRVQLDGRDEEKY
jgi:hypothetical protein